MTASPISRLFSWLIVTSFPLGIANARGYSHFSSASPEHWAPAVTKTVAARRKGAGFMRTPFAEHHPPLHIRCLTHGCRARQVVAARRTPAPPFRLLCRPCYSPAARLSAVAAPAAAECRRPGERG